MNNKRLASCALALCLSALPVGLATAEPYVQVHGGIGFPSRLSSFEGEYWSKGRFSVSDLALQSGPAFGVKAGYWFSSMPAFGVDLDYLHTAPGDKKQDYWLTMYNYSGGPNRTIGATEPTISLRVDSLSINAALRYPGETWQPYVAIGPALLWGNYGGDPTNTTLGLNLEAGIRVVVWKGLFLTTSYRYQQARFTFREASGPNAELNGFNAFYQNSFALVGLGWNF